MDKLGELNTEYEIEIDKTFDLLKKLSPDDGRFAFNQVPITTYYLPPVNELAHLLGFDNPMLTNIKQVEKDYRVDIKIGRSSLYNLFGVGVGLRVLDKLKAWFKLLPLTVSNLKYKRAMYTALRYSQIAPVSQACYWMSAVGGFKASQHYETAFQHFDLMFNFVGERAKSEINLIRRFKKGLNGGSLETVSKAELWQQAIPLWENTKVAPELMDSFNKLIQHKTLTTATIESIVAFRLEFYLELTSLLDLGTSIKSARDTQELTSKSGFITRAVQHYLDRVECTCCFGGLIVELKHLFKSKGYDLGYRKLATFIIIDEQSDSSSGYKLKEKQYDRLKEWKNGVTKPSSKKLEQFFSNLSDYLDIEYSEIWLDFSRALLAWDKLKPKLISELDFFSSDEVESVFCEVLANLHRYYQSNLQVYVENMQPSA